MKKLTLAIMLAMLALPVAVNAQQTPASGSLRAVCAADIQTLCSNMAPDDQRKCLLSNRSKLSQDCGTALANAQSARKEYSQACDADIQKYCGTEPAGPARRKCALANSAYFSQQCQNVLAASQHTPGK